MNRERVLQAFHAAHPGITRRAFARGGSYTYLAARVGRGERVLDLACGDGPMLPPLSFRGAKVIGIDLSLSELTAASGTRGETLAQARAQALPFAARTFDSVTCHLAFMLFDDVPAVVRELERVLVPGGNFFAVLGGGPTSHGDDAFHRFLAILARYPRTTPRFGDPRARTEAGWSELMPGWTVAPFERWELDLSGTFDEVWTMLGGSYEVAPEHAEAIREELRSSLRVDPEERVECMVVVFLASATTPAEDTLLEGAPEKTRSQARASGPGGSRRRRARRRVR